MRSAGTLHHFHSLCAQSVTLLRTKSWNSEEHGDLRFLLHPSLSPICLQRPAEEVSELHWRNQADNDVHAGCNDSSRPMDYVLDLIL